MYSTRPRPLCLTLARTPSGHVTGTAALFGMTALIVTVGRSRSVRAVAAAGAVGVVGIVAATRLYLGVHWLTDVVAGALLASLVVTIGAASASARPASRTDARSDPCSAAESLLERETADRRSSAAAPHSAATPHSVEYEPPTRPAERVPLSGGAERRRQGHRQLPACVDGPAPTRDVNGDR